MKTAMLSQQRTDESFVEAQQRNQYPTQLGNLKKFAIIGP